MALRIVDWLYREILTDEEKQEATEAGLIPPSVECCGNPPGQAEESTVYSPVRQYRDFVISVSGQLCNRR
jgi:hypothetical protein